MAMVHTTVDEMETAYHFASADSGDEQEAYICLTTGKMFFYSPYGESDELPDDIETSDQYLAIPNQHELNLGQPLIFEFIRTSASHLELETEEIFRKRGAYSRFKSMLCHNGLLDDWHAFENQETSDAIRAWCADNGIGLLDSRRPDGDA